MHKIKKKTIQVSILRLSAPLLYQQNQKKKKNPRDNFKAFCSFTLCTKSKKKKIHVSILRLSAPLLYAQNQKKIHLSIFHRTWKTSFWALLAPNPTRFFQRKTAPSLFKLLRAIPDKSFGQTDKLTKGISYDLGSKKVIEIDKILQFSGYHYQFIFFASSNIPQEDYRGVFWAPSNM